MKKQPRQALKAPPHPRLKFILFDIDDTLFPSTEFSRKARNAAIQAMVKSGLPATPQKASFLLEKIISKKGSNYPLQFDLLCKSLHARNPTKIVASGIRAYHDQKRKIQPFPDAVKTLSALSSAGFSLCIATEGLSKKQWDKLIRLGLQDSFSKVFISEDLHLKKSPPFYRKICRLLHARPKDCMMVGDNPTQDICSAKSAGLVCVRVLKGKNANKKAPCKPHFSIRRLSQLVPLLSKKDM